MRNFKSFRPTILLILGLYFLCCNSLTAQSDLYLTGYVITMKGDTLFGTLKKLSDDESCYKVKFINVQNESQKIKEEEIQAYKRGNDYYVRKRAERPIFTNGFALMKLVLKGKANLYEYKYTTYSGGQIPMATASTDYYIEKDNQFVFVKRMGFKKTMLSLFADNEKLCNLISNKIVGYQDIVDIVLEYNKSN